MRMYPTAIAQLVRLAVNQMMQPKPVMALHQLHDRDDGLHHCKVCGGAEASLPTHCPEERMRETTVDLVQSGSVDFFQGIWRTLPPLSDSYLENQRNKQAYLQSLGA